MTASNRPSNAQLYFGTDDSIVALNPFVDTGYAFQGQGTILRRTILGQVNRTADGVDAGFSVRAALRFGTGITPGTRGFVVMYRTDATDCWVIPVIVAGVQEAAPAAGIVGDVYTFVQDGEDGNGAIASTNVKTSGSITLATGEIGYDVVTTGGGQGVKLKTAGFTVTGAFGVGGAPMVAEGNL